MPRLAKEKPTDKFTATIGFETKLWLTADKLRNTIDAAECKHVVIGLSYIVANMPLNDSDFTPCSAGIRGLDNVLRAVGNRLNFVNNLLN